MTFVRYEQLPAPGPARTRILRQWQRRASLSGVDMAMAKVLKRTPSDATACLVAIEHLAARATTLGGVSEDVQLDSCVHHLTDTQAREAADLLLGFFAAPRCFGGVAGAAAALVRRGVVDSKLLRAWALAIVDACLRVPDSLEALEHLRPLVQAVAAVGHADIAGPLRRLLPGATTFALDGEALAANLLQKSARRKVGLPSGQLVLADRLAISEPALWSAKAAPSAELRFGPQDSVLLSWGAPVRWARTTAPLDATGLLAGDPSFFAGVDEEAVTGSSLDTGELLKASSYGGDKRLPAAVCLSDRQDDWSLWVGKDEARHVVAVLLVPFEPDRPVPAQNQTVTVPVPVAKALKQSYRFFSLFDRRATLAEVKARLPTTDSPRASVSLKLGIEDWLPIARRSLQVRRSLDDVLAAMLKVR